MKKYMQARLDQFNRSRAGAAIKAGVVTVTGFAAQAHAALPPEAEAAFSKITSGVTDVQALAWVALGLSVGGFTLMRLVKRGASRAI
ncbi:hypothetical protein AZSI13_07630 [Azospira sp. I13]|uniref:major coat protein n=1 Tax=Azospira sp. I13 TaxID=1765050 RepID=UPI000D4A2317|nr:major coat protein [Azospira sp. I13]GBG01436.1 hypothetical protein AZSI13_07630 [Azospira sp. I13]